MLAHAALPVLHCVTFESNQSCGKPFWCCGEEGTALGLDDDMTGRFWRHDLIQPFEDCRDVAGSILRFNDAAAIDLAAAMKDGFGLLAKDFRVVVGKVEDAGETQPPAEIGRFVHCFVLTDGAGKPFQVTVCLCDDAGNRNSCAYRRILSDCSEYV